MRNVIVIECNEVPYRVWDEYTCRNPDSTLAWFLGKSKKFTTVADDVEWTSLYPSQTWASLNTGAPYAEHKIHWYNDPKPSKYPFYWKAIAAGGKRVGYINTLHSSPLVDNDDGFCFAIPDCFAESSDTYPARYQRFQAFNLAVTKANGRKASMASILRESLRLLANPFAIGLSLWSVREIFETVASIALGGNVERLRNLQYPLIAELFWQELHRTDPELAILFTNHIAATMHRYWYALFPEDYPEELYSNKWKRCYESEILRAVALFENDLKRLLRFCESTDRILVICSSMGQAANPFLDKNKVNKSAHIKVDQSLKFLAYLDGDAPGVMVEGAMIPQYSFKYPTTNAAANAERILENNARKFNGLRVKVNRTENVVTLSVRLMDQEARIEYNGTLVAPRDLGATLLQIDDHHSGKHCPEGSLIVFNDTNDSLFPSDRFAQSFSYLKFAPELKRYFLSSSDEPQHELIQA